jgi:hypothetical protein
VFVAVAFQIMVQEKTGSQARREAGERTHGTLITILIPALLEESTPGRKKLGSALAGSIAG